jgi:hypothetical protein
MKVVIIGGFGSGKPALSAVKRRYQKKFPKGDIRFFSFSYAMSHIPEVQVACEDAHIVTHSAGCLLIDYLEKVQTVVITAPIQKMSRRRYTFGFIKQIIQMNELSKWKLQFQIGAELATHPLANFKWVLNNRINTYDFGASLKAIVEKAATTTVIVYSKDIVAPIGNYDLDTYEALGAETLVVNAEHDAIYFDDHVT